MFAAMGVDGMTRPYLSFSVLCYNEVDSIEPMARLCSDVLDACGKSYELVLVDDGSTDGSRDLIRRLQGELPRCRAIYHPRNLGIGAGIRTCFFETRGEWATWFPADLQADPRELPRLLRELSDCDALITYRDSRHRCEKLSRKFISLMDRTLVRWLFGLSLKDLHWIRFFRRELLDRMILTSRSPFIDTEMVVCAKRLGARINETPLADRPREHGVAKGATLANVVSAVNELVILRLRWPGHPGDLSTRAPAEPDVRH
jgi:glycosyltransferase involved in cell wall biosynthesis